jgi:hypothetical protein
LHGIAYYIFLKPLRSLEKFRKNPHVKIPPKSPFTNFPSLGKFKIQFLFERNYSSEFRPLGPAGWPNPPQPKPPAHSASQPASPRMPLAYFAEDVFFFDSRLPSSAPSLSPLADAWAPLVSSFVHPAPADPDCTATESRCIRPLRTTTPHLEMPPEPLLAPQSLPPLQVAP